MADKPGDKLIQISTAFQRYGEPEPYARTVVCLDETDDVEGVAITWHPEEHRVIETWARLLREHKADVLVGYNTCQFDWRYISGRCGVLVDDDTGDPLVDCELLGRMVEAGGGIREFELNSGAYGDNKFFVLDTPGVQQIDLLQFIRRNYSLASYRCGPQIFSRGVGTTMLEYVIGLIALYVLYNIGILMEIRCPARTKGESLWATLCRRNGPVVKWFAGVALFMLVVFGVYNSLR